MTLSQVIKVQPEVQLIYISCLATTSDPPVVKTTTGLATSNRTTPATTTLITTTTTGSSLNHFNPNADSRIKYISVTPEISGFGEVTCYVDFIGDQYCDDLNNKEECSFDGGDCCPAENVTLYVPWQTYCTECCCKDESGTILTCDNGTCQDFQLYVGDGYCDDITNHEDCGKSLSMSLIQKSDPFQNICRL